MLHSTLSRLAVGFALFFTASTSTYAEEISLFNGKDLDAWTFDTGSRSEEDKVKKEDFWLVKNGVLIYRGSLGHGTLRHEKVYEAEYALSLEWRWPTNISSGADIVLHSSAEKDDVGRRKEVRVSLNVDEAGDIVYRGTPERYDTTRGRQTDKDLEKDEGQWNQLQIICREKMITVLVNGQPVNQVTDAPLSKGAIGLGTAPVPIVYRNVKLIRPLGPEHVRAENAAKPLAAAWARIVARKKAEELKKEQDRLAEEQREKERMERLVAERDSVVQRIRDAVSSGDKAEVAAKLNAKALPYPRDARELRFNKTAGMIDFKSGSSLKALVAFYLSEMAKRGWVENESEAKMEEDSINLVFEAADAKFELELDERSDYVDVSIDTDGVDFSDLNDPAALAALGIPQPRKALLLQKEVAIPADAQRLSFDDDRCMFYSTMKLNQAFAHFGGLIKKKGYRESRRPILSSSRNYTEFKRGGVELSVNIFSDPVGTRIILRYNDGKKDPVVPPLAEVVLANAKSRSSASEVAGGLPATGTGAAGKTPIDVAKNKGSNTAEAQGKFVDIAPPIPDDAEDFGRSGTNYAKTYTAKVDMSLQKTAEFYRTALTAQQWRAIEAPSPGASEEVLRFRNSIGTMTVKLKSNGNRTDISVRKQDDKKAKEDGVMPERGKGRLILANAHEVRVVFTIGKTNYPVRAGAGAKNFKDALNYSVGPGNYNIVIKIPGQRPKTERVDITEGSTWAVIAVPTGGYISMQLY